MRGLKAGLLATTFLTFLPVQVDAAPVAFAALASIAGSYAAGLIAGTAIVFSSVLASAAVAAVGAGLSMLAQKQAPGPEARDITLNKVQPVTDGLILYGERMLGGSITARSVTSAGGKTNGRYHSVMPLACHEIEGVLEVWVGEQKVWTAEQYALDEGGAGDEWTWGQIDSDYRGHIRLRVYNGSDDQAADPRYVAAADEWTFQARGRGIAYIYFEADFDADIFPRGVENIRARVRGKKVLDPRTGVTGYSENPALHFLDYATTPEDRGGIGWLSVSASGPDALLNGDFGAGVAVGWSKNAPANFEVIDGVARVENVTGVAGITQTVGLIPGRQYELVVSVVGLHGTTSANISLDDGAAPAWVGDLAQETAGIGISVQRFTATVDQATLALYVNSGVVGAYIDIDYAFIREVVPTDVDWPAVIALANICDEAVSLDGGGSEVRYAFNGVLSTADAPEANLDRLATAWGGWWVVDRGKLTAGGAAYQLPSFEIDESICSGPVKVNARKPFEQQFNQVKALYADPDSEFVATDLPVLKSATYQAEDNGEALVSDLGELPGETSFSRGQRLQKRVLLRARRQKRVEIPCTLAAWDVSIGDTVEVSLARRGWVRKEFEVERRVVSIQPGKVEVRLSLIETSAAVDDWNTSEELPRPAGGASTLPSPFAKPLVAVPATTETLYETRGGGGVKLRVALLSSTNDPFVEEWQFAWGLASGAVADYTVGPKQAGPALVIDDLKPGTYVFGVRARNLRGLWSDWLYGSPEVIEGRNEAPSALTGFSVQALGALALAKWDRHPSTDVQQGGEIEFRHSADLGASWTTSTTVARSVQGVMTEAPLPLKAGRYFARAKDSQGVTSGVASFEVSRTGLDGLSLLFENEAAPAFAGAKSGVTLFGSEVRLDDGVSAGSVAFAERIDLGSVQDVRAVSDVRARVASPASAFGQSGGLFGAAGVPFGESGGAEGDVQMWVRSTLVDPDLAGAGDWSPWQRLDAADFTARGFEVEARLLADADDFVVAVTGMKISIYG